ncbi:oxygen-independent coproporphyrinogen III oxidase [Belliella kenyensis]|uniref:Coproporphyrinogen-III oxidase n=1 Tax=Belliella kenyensis TaxID=1472724 RepID=A0ABV8END4_9BACT|nr:oxygen-independent coproporphyrinogen III oxidase [Belliella kenyensis]MCH7400674.1 oxygen-independent coproporphyrinogen III oxidase [Belliella kenyensis]MDN3602039.1 oxygen-independent coproporphyrinogen III oxidase [Belliella kenyensis]
MQTQEALIKKYNVPAPRYTSYPTVPLWQNDLKEGNWAILVKKAYQDFGLKEGISLYIHLPYCESLCTYCGCNKRITKNHAVESPYKNSLMKEWDMYMKIFGRSPRIATIHLGGGTPTFFSPETLKSILEHILGQAELSENAELSFEGHPNNTTIDHLKTLYKLGFKRVSYGIQDFNLEVQKAIHRIQPFERVKEATENAKQIGYESVNFDLIYGLPFQTLSTISDTLEKVKKLSPDRIAFYSYAHLPTVFPAQKSYESHLPHEAEKRALYERGREILSSMGYMEIGMDHFAKPNDPLSIAKTNKTLHRNFMGYTTSPSKILIGLGNSAISDIHYAYKQNAKDIKIYQDQIDNHLLTASKSHMMSYKDIQNREMILSLICNQSVSWSKSFLQQVNKINLTKLNTFQNEGLIKYNSNGLKVLAKGQPFIRNICSIFDERMQENEEKLFGFSKVI